MSITANYPKPWIGYCNRMEMKKMPGGEPYSIVLADDHGPFREGLRKMLSERKDLKIVGEVADGIELLNFLQMSKSIPDMAIVDITMPNLGGIEATRRFKVTHPEVKVLILTIHKGKGYVNQAFSAGAEGYMLKEDIGTDLFPAIETIMQGKVYVPPLSLKNFTEETK